MLPRSHRLTRNRDIVGVLRRGERRRVPPLELRVGRPSPKARFAFVISTKVSKRAVVRNRIRRRLRAVIAAKLAVLPARDYVIVVNPGAPTLTRVQLIDQFTHLLGLRTS